MDVTSLVPIWIIKIWWETGWFAMYFFYFRFLHIKIRARSWFFKIRKKSNVIIFGEQNFQRKRTVMKRHFLYVNDQEAYLLGSWVTNRLFSGSWHLYLLKINSLPLVHESAEPPFSWHCCLRFFLLVLKNVYVLQKNIFKAPSNGAFSSDSENPVVPARR